MKTAILIIAALSLLAVYPAKASCFYHCNPNGYGGTVCHWNCY